MLKKGDKVDAMVLNIDAENQRLSLGLKQLATDVWDEFFSQHNVGDLVEGKVVRMTNFGAFVELADGIEGLIHVSEFDDAQGAEKIDLEVEKAYQMKVIKLSPARAEDRPQHPRDEVGRVPRRLGVVRSGSSPARTSRWAITSGTSSKAAFQGGGCVMRPPRRSKPVVRADFS